MDNLKSIWNNLNAATTELETVMKAQSMDNSIYEQLKKEAILRKRFNPVLVVLIIGFMGVFTWMVASNSDVMGATEMIGIICVVLSAIIIGISAQVVKMPLKEFEYNQSSIDFMQIVKVKLNQVKTMLIIGLVLQITFLTIGIYLLTLYNVPTPKAGMVGGFFGTMGGLMGLSIGGGIAGFNRHYKAIYDKIELFLKD